ncbi:hypothetical protein G6F40_016141 [Rhizopus arrhizus]|nr:hypothetical protein G6F40_016141 [Rhizopus arrhizus]
MPARWGRRSRPATARCRTFVRALAAVAPGRDAGHHRSGQPLPGSVQRHPRRVGRAAGFAASDLRSPGGRVEGKGPAVRAGAAAGRTALPGAGVRHHRTGAYPQAEAGGRVQGPLPPGRRPAAAVAVRAG